MTEVNSKIKQFFYRPAADADWDGYDARNMWMIECEIEVPSHDYKKSAMYKWLIANCTGCWEIESMMTTATSHVTPRLFVILYDRIDAVLFSSVYNKPLPVEYDESSFA